MLLVVVLMVVVCEEWWRGLALLARPLTLLGVRLGVVVVCEG